MNLNLFSPNLLVIVAIIFASLMVYVLTIGKYQRKHKKLGIIVGAGLAGAGLLHLLVHRVFAGEVLPLVFGMSLPFTLSIALLVVNWKAHWRVRGITIGAAFFGLLFGLLLTNNYYQYYPHLRDALHRTNRASLQVQAAHAVVVRYGATNKIAQKTSVEQSLPALPDLPATGHLYNVTIPGTVSGFKNRGARVYVPPLGFAPQKINLPVVVLLAGEPGTPDDWILGGGVEETMNNFAHQHHGVAPLIFVVDNLGSQFNDTECVDSSRGNVETYLTKDVPAYIKAQFDVNTDPASWAIGGLSDGGMCGIMITLRHSDVYHYFLDFGGSAGPDVGSQAKTIHTLFNGSLDAWQQHQPGFLLQNHDYKKGVLGGYFAAGKSDSFSVTNAVLTLYNQSAAKGLDVAYESIDGKHTFDVWKQSFRDSMPWLSYHLGATICVSNCY